MNMYIDPEFKKKEITRTICIWFENVNTRSDLDLKRMNDMNISLNEMMVNVDTTITACTSCASELRLSLMSTDEIMKIEMGLYKLMSDPERDRVREQGHEQARAHEPTTHSYS
ncbi:hypothetical protein Asppvi_003441 [Aspergillus pseudoviridinutans]|uniref:Uncharacterized protein n=1 Tax=Aspergillus pseudoviridinutans TaxID=1517512 RepID=A0A9P3ER45_9EURO|nr:uncharacterized protein Asppvi_003441 [Aspergillus pseudoviridinutans]GIJ84594.1 hypothetical protein Asppvi_003441 [Aspergillus pseudoviridinutans]